MRTNKPSRFSRRDFLKTTLLLPAFAFLTACARALSLSTPVETTTIDSPLNSTNVTPTKTVTPTPDPCDSNVEAAVTSETGCSDKRPSKTRNLRDIDFAIIHHSAGAAAKDMTELLQRAKDIEDQHKREKRWAEKYKTGGEYDYSYIQYHWLLANDGSKLQVQCPKYVRVHADSNNYNCRSIAICIIGDFRTDGEKKYPCQPGETPSDNQSGNTPSLGQIESASEIIRDWKLEHGVQLSVLSHRKAKYEDENEDKCITCPGNNMGDSDNPDSNLSFIVKLVNH